MHDTCQRCMWDVLAGLADTDAGGERCSLAVSANIKEGSCLVLQTSSEA